jgi:ubiquinone/menaquinone biosynthesis C-methylase UbiE
MTSNSFDEGYYDRGERGGFPSKYTWENVKHEQRRKLVQIEKQYKNFGIKSILFGCCARGYEVKIAREMGYEAFGFDISQYAIDTCDQSIKEYIQVGNALNIKSPEDQFDLVALYDCIHIIDPNQRWKAYDEINRVAKTGIIIRTRLLDYHSDSPEFDGSFDGIEACRESFYTLRKQVMDRKKFEFLYCQISSRFVGTLFFLHKKYFKGTGRLRLVKSE